MRLPEAENSARPVILYASNSPVTHVLLAEIHLPQRNYAAFVEDLDIYLKLDLDSSFSVRTIPARAEAQRRPSQKLTSSTADKSGP